MNPSKPIRVAIVGSGPSGLYSAGHLLETRDLSIEIDIFEKLPTPWGLVRGGVAPDHPEKKLVIDRLFDFWLKDPRVQFFGNVEIGSDLRHDELAAWYHAVIYATGADGDVKMGIRGEEMAGSHSAREFIAFYNGHPDFSSHYFDLKTMRAVVVGNGNVALDVARMLTMDPSQLARTDIADVALKKLEESRIREVVILGRRGPLQAAYNNPELEELEHLSNTNFLVPNIDLNDIDPALVAAAGPIVQRKLETLRRLVSQPRKPEYKRITFQFLQSPLEVQGDGRVQRLVTSCNSLEVDESGRQVLKSTSTTQSIECGLIFRAVGYRGTELPGLPFDEGRGVIRNNRGRVANGGGVLPGTYTTGWIKRGCNGIIGSNKKCANETVDHLREDLGEGRLSAPSIDRLQIKTMLLKRIPRLVSLTQWVNIDHAERSAGRVAGRPRVKITSAEDLLATAFSKTS